MSAIVGIKEYSGLLGETAEKDFFARCITGYQYTSEDHECDIKNCLISLLNSKVIDVDKLDYLIRDAFITGFDTVNIDYERLLTSLIIIVDNDRYELAYHKSAISVLENVVYAHDSERKWIQSHPVVLYEAYILQHVFTHLSKNLDYKRKRLFSIESLSRKRHKLRNNTPIRLMCDDDIIYLMKNVYPNELSEEFFERKKRRHPIWKSEAEYKAFFLQITGRGGLLTDFEKAMEITAKYLVKSTDSWVIDDALIEKIEKDLRELNNRNLDERNIKIQKKDKTEILRVMKCLKNYSNELGRKCDFVILKASQFYSGFSKPDFSKTNIVFYTEEGEKLAKSGEIVSSLEAKDKERDNFFIYLRKEKMDKTTILIKKKFVKDYLQNS